MLKINEIFFAVQGEGVNIGKPSIFIRMNGCNLNCNWCDTKYTWHPDYLEASLKMTDDDLIKEIEKYNCGHIVWTGGEPVLQQYDIFDFLVMDLPSEYTYEIETNGTKEITHEFAADAEVITVSPKLHHDYDLDILYNYYQYHRTVWKFVVSATKHIHQIKKKFIEPLALHNEDIYIMPEGQTREEQLQRMPKVIRWAKENNWNFSPRIQILAYNTKRGV